MTQPEQYLDTSGLAELLKVAPDTVRGWRKRGTGPRALMVGGAVRYAWTDVQRWLNQTNGLPGGR